MPNDMTGPPPLLGADGQPIQAGGQPRAQPPAQAGQPQPELQGPPPDMATIALHTVQIPLPTEDAQELLNSCVRPIGEQPMGMDAEGNPIMQPVFGVAVSTETILTWLETTRALKQRDEKIASLEARIAALEAK